MHTSRYSSKKNLYQNLLFIGILFFIILLYIFLVFNHPKLEYPLLIFLVNIPLFVYFLVLYNSIRFEISPESLIIRWAFGSREVPLRTVTAYYDYEEPLFEVHIETRMIGSKITRHDIGSFYYFTPGIRSGLIIEYNPTGYQMERVLIVPKNKSSFINILRMNILEKSNKRIEEFHNRYYVK